MNGHDDISVLETLDGPVEPRAEFSAALWQLIESEATPHAPAPSPAPAPRRTWFVGRSMRVRVALAFAVLVVVCVGVAVAARVARVWVDAGDQGTQLRRGVVSASSLAAPAGPESTWARFALGPGGHDLYAIGWPPSMAPGAWDTTTSATMVVYHGVDTPHPTRSTLHLRLPDSIGQGWISVAPTGQVFVGLSHSVVRIDPGGHARTVVSLRQLGIPDDAVVLQQGIAVAAASTDHLIVRAELGGPRMTRDYGDYRFFEVTDPNRDGRWSDVKVQRIALPRSVPVTRAGAKRNPWQSVQLLPESAAPGGGTSSAVIATMLSLGGEFRVYRLNDRNSDGDVTDPGETRLLLDQFPDSAGGFWGPTVTIRRVSADGARIELAAAALTREGRISVVSPTGAIHEIARSLPTDDFPEGILAGPNGRVYPLIRSIQPGEHWYIDRFTVTAAAPAATDPSSAAGSITWHAPSGLGNGVLVFTSRGVRTWTTTVGGGRPHPLLGDHASPDCLSADGRTLFYGANLEAKNEWFLYAADAGSAPQKLTERGVEVACPATADGVLLIAGGGGYSRTLIWHDLRTGHERLLARNVLRYSLSTDGRRLVYVGGLDFSDGWPPSGHERLIQVDLTTGKRMQLAAGLAESSFGVPNRGGYDGGIGRDAGVRWSPDGRRVAYITGPSIYRPDLTPAKVHDHDFVVPPQHYTLWVRDAATGRLAFRSSLTGGPPSISWSPNGARLLVCTNTRTLLLGCPSQFIEDSAYNSNITGQVIPHSLTRLLVVDPTHGTTVNIAHAAIGFAEWSPNGKDIAYATPTALYTLSANGKRQLITPAPAGGWATSPSWAVSSFKFSGWLGYSPTGAYIVLTRGDALDAINVTTGKITRLTHQPVLNVGWWAPGTDFAGVQPLWG